MIKKLTTILSLFLLFSFTFNLDCGDGNVYANKKQTIYDKRFDGYVRIQGVPKFRGGEKKLQKFVKENLSVSEEAKTQIFRLNFQFTVRCDGAITDVKQIGDPKMDDWTNIKKVIQSTEGNWKPAKKNGQPVHCVYFTSLTVVGGKY